MKFKQYLNEEITDSEIKDLISKWKSKLGRYGITNVDLSTHSFKRLNHERNTPPISVEDLDFTLDGFLRKMGSQFKKDIDNVKNHTARKRGIHKEKIPDNNLEFTVKSNKTKTNLVFVLKQDFKKKGTAMVLPITMMRKKNFKTTKGEEIIVERREIWI